METFLTAIMVIAIVTGLVVGFGGFNLTTPGGAHISFESDYAEVEQARLAAETERTRIAAVTAVTIAQEQEQTARIVWPVTVVALSVAAIGVAWSRRPHRPGVLRPARRCRAAPYTGPPAPSGPGSAGAIRRSTCARTAR